jgi:glycosyltransferase involved in cell wall biosynthesis
MKIAFVSLMDIIPWGGSEELWYKTAKLAIAKGHIVITLSQSWDSTPQKIIELKELGATNKFYFKPAYTIKDRFLIKLKLKRSEAYVVPNVDADVYIISNGSTMDFLQKESLCEKILKSGKPYLFISQHNFENGGLINVAKRVYAAEVIKKAKKFFFVSDRNRQTAERQLAIAIDNAGLISNPFTIKKAGLKPYPVSTNTLSMACVARLDCNFKGQDILLQALSSEKWKTRDYSLKFYGSGLHKENLEQLVIMYGLSSKVSFEGQVADVDEIWTKNQVLVLPSVSEGTPLALIEAMLSGRAAVATDVGDNSRYILNNKTGFLVETASVNSLSIGLENLWENRERLSAMGENAFIHAQNITDPEPEKTLLKSIESIN